MSAGETGREDEEEDGRMECEPARARERGHLDWFEKGDRCGE